MRSLSLKLLLAFIAVSLVGTVLLGIVASQSIDMQFGSYVNNQREENLAAALEAYYRANGSWDGVEDQISVDARGGQGFGARDGGSGNGRGGGLGNSGISGAGSSYELVGMDGKIVASSTGLNGQAAAAEDLAAGLPVIVDGRQVGTLIAHHGSAQQLTAAGQQFMDSLRWALLVAALGATALAVMLAIWLARTLTRPLGELTRAASAVSAGELGRRVSVSSGDEVGRLAQAFNDMSQQLAQAQDARRQMTADIAHELRTPLTVILGQSEAMRDRVLPASSENLELVHDEAQRLSRMVEDLRTLSLAEAGELKLQRNPVKVGALLEKSLAKARPQAAQKNIELNLDLERGLPSVNLDLDRMEQVIDNLLTNALRHTPEGGRIGLAALSGGNGAVRIEMSDSGPGIASGDLVRVFDRFYRADKARPRDSGGAGLGLAISRSIVEAHGGRIWAESPPGQGAHFYVELG
ncbi:MAG: ATP-binding protein [Anaerolineales bacterium]